MANWPKRALVHRAQHQKGHPIPVGIIIEKLSSGPDTLVGSSVCFRKGLKATEGCTTDESETEADAHAPASLTSQSCSALLCTIGSPPSLKSIFIFAVLTFCSFYQRHNEASCSCTGALLHADKTPRREEALVYRRIPSVQTIYPIMKTVIICGAAPTQAWPSARPRP